MTNLIFRMQKNHQLNRQAGPDTRGSIECLHICSPSICLHTSEGIPVLVVNYLLIHLVVP
jgi:hypothetical protein